MSGVRQESQYLAIQQLHEQKGYAVSALCKLIQLNRSSYYKWLTRNKSRRELENEALLKVVCALYEEYDGILGYRRMTMYINRRLRGQINHKRIYRLMHLAQLKSVIRRKKSRYKKSTPQIIAENKLNRKFDGVRLNEKWVTDITELSYGNGQRAYLSAILDLTDKRIVSFNLGHSNNNPLVIKTLDDALSQCPHAKPLFHSDRGNQYTSKTFHYKLQQAGLEQSMSRVGRCLDNGPMEGFWGSLKAEMYHRRKFRNFEDLKSAISAYMHFYNYDRLQKKLGARSPMEYHVSLLI